uniref:Uncharacterized protein n=1 Tax=Anguilla anguilla TaxID=7936 RepID=A0A0E9RZD7_ANGAN
MTTSEGGEGEEGRVETEKMEGCRVRG